MTEAEITEALEVWEDMATRVEAAGDSEIDHLGARYAITMLSSQRDQLLARMGTSLYATDEQLARVNAAADRLERALRSKVEN